MTAGVSLLILLFMLGSSIADSEWEFETQDWRTTPQAYQVTIPKKKSRMLRLMISRRARTRIDLMRT